MTVTAEVLAPPPIQPSEISRPEIYIPQSPEVLHRTEQVMDTSTAETICPSEDIGMKSVAQNGDSTRVVRLLQIPDAQPRQAALVVMTEKATGQDRLLLVGLKPDEQGNLHTTRRLMALHNGRRTTLGRLGNRQNDEGIIGAASLWGDGETFGADVSRRHLSIEYRDGQITLTDSSENGTELFPPAKLPDTQEENTDSDSHISEHTMRAKEAARMRGLMSIDPSTGKELFAEREVIDRNTTDPEGKVDIRSWKAGGEAIVVDSKKDPEPYKKLLETIESKLSAKGVFNERDIVQAVFDTVSESMQYDLEYADQIADNLTSNSRKIALGSYIEEGRGVCRHMALTCQWLGARMAEKYPKLFEGTSFTTPVNQRTLDNAAHEWARYNGRNGEVYILDPAQGFFGTLSEVAQDERLGIKRWEYFKDGEERKLYQAKALGNVGVKPLRLWRRPKR